MALKRSVYALMMVSFMVSSAGQATRADSVDDSKNVSAGTDNRSATEKIAWRDDAHAAMAEARQSGKLVFFDIGASWCPNCKKMQETTYRNPAICNQLNQNFICVQLDKDDNADGSKLCDALLIMALPTVLIVDAKTDKYIMKVGYQDSAKFQAMIAKVQKNGLHGGNSGFRLTPKVYGNQ